MKKNFEQGSIEDKRELIKGFGNLRLFLPSISISSRLLSPFEYLIVITPQDHQGKK